MMESFTRSLRSMRSSSNEGNSTRQGNKQTRPSDRKEDIEDDFSKFDSAFECNICLDTAREAVVSMCGHLFCWPCLHKWLYETDSNTQSHKTCPVCKSAISSEKIIPIYGRGGGSRQDPRDKLPPRPAGQRTEVPSQQNQFPYGNLWALGGPGAQIFGFGDGGFHMSVGIGSLPQYFLAFLQVLYTANAERNDFDHNCFFMSLFLICGCLLIMFIMLFY